MDEKLDKPQGLGAVSPDKRREIASLGGKAAQTKGTAHKYSREEARAAAKKRWQKVPSEPVVESEE